MSLPRFPSINRKAENDGPSSNVTAAPSHSLSGRDSVGQPDKNESSLTDTISIAEKSKVATTNYIYYQIYAEDGGIPSKTPVTPGNPFVGRIKARSVPPPHTAKAVKRSIAKVENIKDRESTALFLTPYSQTPMDDAEKVTILNGAGPGSTPREPLALVAKMSDSERRVLESEGRGGLASTAEPDTTIQYLYYLLYADDYEIPSKVAFDPEGSALGRIQADSVAPPHSPTTMKRCISRVEGNPSVTYADFFADTSSDTPLKEGYPISILRSPALSLNEPMAIVLRSIPDGKYLIKNRAKDIYWNAGHNPIKIVYFWFYYTIDSVKTDTYNQWDITNDNNGNIFMRSVGVPSSWVGANMTGSTVPVPWRLIPANGKSYYFTTDFRYSQNPRVPAMPEIMYDVRGSMASLKKGDPLQMWEFIRI